MGVNYVKRIIMVNGSEIHTSSAVMELFSFYCNLYLNTLNELFAGPSDRAV